MLRTRDFVLFLTIAIFLVAGILFTLTRHSSVFSVPNFTEAPAPAGDVLTTSAATNTIDRPSTIARLKDKIGDFLVLTQPSPSVVSEGESVATSTEGEPSEGEDSTGDVAALTKCAGASDGLVVASKWPRENVQVSTVGDTRVFSVIETAPIPGDVFGVEGGVVTLLQLPLTPSTGSKNCVDSEIVGVTVSGSLIFNTDAIFYEATGAETLIGYARDGVPIYGSYRGETDSCGGYTTATGYRYSVSPERSFIIGCYAGTVQPFTI